jgi:hypothetical protein
VQQEKASTKEKQQQGGRVIKDSVQVHLGCPGHLSSPPRAPSHLKSPAPSERSLSALQTLPVHLLHHLPEDASSLKNKTLTCSKPCPTSHCTQIPGLPPSRTGGPPGDSAPPHRDQNCLVPSSHMPELGSVSSRCNLLRVHSTPSGRPLQTMDLQVQAPLPASV